MIMEFIIYIYVNYMYFIEYFRFKNNYCEVLVVFLYLILEEFFLFGFFSG